MQFFILFCTSVFILIPGSFSAAAAADRSDFSEDGAMQAQTPQRIHLSSSALPAMGVDRNYILGVGDQLEVEVFNVPEYSGSQRVLADGSLNLPAIGKVPVAGLTIEAAETAIATRYQSELRYPRITLVLQQPRSFQVTLSGEVNSPGAYTLDGGQFPTLVQAIQASGGLTYAANLRQVQIRRLSPSGARQTVAVDLWELLQNGDASQNIALRDGDAVFVPAVETVNLTESAQLAASNLIGTPETLDIGVVGEVFRPGIYRLTGGESQTNPTVSQAIREAGGIKPSADIRQIQVRRLTRSGTPQTIDIDFWELFQSGDLTQDLALQQGDTISIATAAAPSDAEAAQIVATNLSPDQILVNVVGEIESPGAVRVPANTTLNQAVLAAGGLTDRARNDVELIRLNPNGTIVQQQFEIDFSQNVNAESNPILWNNDVIIVDRNATASFTDGLSRILSPLRNLLPFGFLF
ncbi:MULTISPECIES: SLBB domain-containing protein [Cyanophyceae]|uniref:SLBB domain-containing protein n=2 Tax=Cyanophyceae TaxID=3028117 RepID=UPI000A0F1C88|nr:MULTISPECIES: SLBB domain-containing protein [Cyanophyceae]SMH30398.1 polysaccharide export outer membrane protein [Picosynechococcus sp. OG1]SMQ83892.1 polysaccharide export outer membrane protein [Synechococcus sp. 7002]